MQSSIRVDSCYSWLPRTRRLKKLGSRQAYSRHLVDVMCSPSPQHLPSFAGEVAGEVPEGGEILRVIPIGVGPVIEAIGPEFEVGKPAVVVRHLERLLEQLDVRWPLLAGLLVGAP